MKGVCVLFEGWFDLHRLDGIGSLKFDEANAHVEDKLMRETLARARIKLIEFEEQQRAWRDDNKTDGITHFHARNTLLRNSGSGLVSFVDGN